MTRIETIAEIGPDRRLVIDLPEEVSPGSRHIVLMVLEDQDTGSAHDSEVPVAGELEREGDLLVISGPVPSDLDIRRLIEHDREERMLSVLLGDGG